MSSIVWLASYPKSGNTWVRVLLANYVRDEATPVSINSLADGNFAHAAGRARFDELVGVEASALEQPTISRTRPLLYRQLAAEADETLYVKVHDAWGLADDGTPLFPADATAGVVYIVRNPLDVAGSFANHAGVELETVVEWMCSDSHVMAEATERIGPHLAQRLTSWSGHVRSWLHQSALPHVVVRYEDLHRDPAAIFSKVVRFCGLPADERRLRKAIEFSEFGELSRQERADGFLERPGVSRAGFFRRGETDGWRDELPEALARRLIETHCETMRRLGYLDAEAMGVMHDAGIGGCS